MHMNKKNVVIFCLFFCLCSPPPEDGIVSLSGEYNNNYDHKLIEDYPIVLTQCLNEEKGYDIVTPFDIQDLKTTISQLSTSKDEELQLGEDVNYCINKYNLWSDSSSQNPEELAKLYDENLELAKCLREKGINVQDPTQQEPKLDLSGLKSSKDSITPLLQECGWEK